MVSFDRVSRGMRTYVIKLKLYMQTVSMMARKGLGRGQRSIFPLGQYK